MLNLKKQCNEVIIATDDDREGKAIGQSLIDILKLSVYKVVIFNEITSKAIKKGLDNPVDLDKNMVDSAISRMILDKIVGYSLSPLLWQNIENRLSAGRVQSVVVKLVIERENEIKKFNENSYYKITGLFKEIELKSTLNKITKIQKQNIVEKFLNLMIMI